MAKKKKGPRETTTAAQPSRQARRAEARKAERDADKGAPDDGHAPSERPTSKSDDARKPATASKPAHVVDLVREPVFWFGYEISWAKLAFARFVIFALLALDALLQLSHAPRYGAGGFNVAQLPGLDALGPGRVGFEVGQLVCAYLFVHAALGVATKIVIPLGAAIYAWLYFGSQLDSYQHHYLVALVLLIACFVPWQRREEAEPATKIRTWAIRLLLVQLGILYIWAAVSKMSPAWLDGRTLETQITGALRTTIEDTVGFKTAARFALLAELVLAVTVWIRRAWFIALPLGVAFHLGILASNLEIGLFAYLMLGFYLLVVPDVVFVAIAELPPLRFARQALRAIQIKGTVPSAIAIAVSLGAGLALASLLRFDAAFTVVIALTAFPLAVMTVSGLLGRSTIVPWLGLAHVVAIALWLLVDRTTSQAVDYYRFWGGNARRLGEPLVAEQAYRRLTEIAPDVPNGHYQLGKLLLDRGETKGGLDALHEAQRLEPLRARAWIAEAQWLVKQGKKAEAIEKAQEGVYSEPSNQAARELLDTLSGTKSAPPAGTAPAAKPDDDAEQP